MLGFCFITLYPLYNVLIGSFNQGLDYTAGGVYWWPRKWSLDNYLIVISDKRIWQGYYITVMRALFGTLLHLIVTTMVAYAMSRRDLRFKRFFYWVNIITMFFGGGLIPYFVILKYTNLLNSFWVYVIPCAYSVFNMIVFQNFFKQLPEELHESAELDGAGEFRIYARIIIPLSKPIIATVTLWTVVYHWNSYLDSMYFVTDSNLYSLQYVLMRIIKETSVPAGGGIFALPPNIMETISPKTVSLAAIIVTTIPILAIYPFLQKYFAKGIMIGSLKG